MASNGTNKSTIALMKSANGAAVTTNALAEAQKASTLAARVNQIAIRALSIAINMIAFALISEGIQAVANWLSNLNNENEKLEKRISSLKDRFQNLSSEIDEINSKIEENEKRIKEISNLENPTFVDQEELEKLRKQNQLLKDNARYRQESLDIVTKQTNEALDKDLDRYFFTNDAENENLTKSNGILDYATFKGLRGLYKISQNDTTKYDELKEALDNMSALTNLQDAIVDENQALLIQEYQDLMDELNSTPNTRVYEQQIQEIKNSIQKLNNNSSVDLTQFDTLVKSIDLTDENNIDILISENEETLKKSRDLLLTKLSEYNETDPNYESFGAKRILELLNYIDKYLNPDEWIDSTINKIYNDDQFNTITNSINKKTSSGEKITYEDLINDSSYHAIIKKISQSLYNAVDDESMKKAASHLSNKISELLENGDVQLLIPFDEAFSDLAEETKNKLFDLSTAGELSAETIHSTEEYQAILSATGISAEELINTISKLNFAEKETTINELNNILNKLQTGTSLTKDEISKLVAENSDLADAIKITSDGYSLEESTISSLINSNIKLYNESIANEIQRTKTTIEQSNSRIEAIKSEIEAIRNFNSTFKSKSPISGLVADKMLESDETAINNLMNEIDKLLFKNSDLERYLETLHYKEELDTNNNSTLNSIAKDSSFNWIETRITRLQHHFQTMVDSVTDYVSTHFKLNKIDEELHSLDEQISAYQSGAAFYFQKANSIELSDDLRHKVINGEIDIQPLSDETVINAVNDFKEWYEKYLDAIDQEVKLKNDKQAKIREKMDIQAASYQTRQNRLSAASDRLNDTIDNKNSRGKMVSTAYYQRLIQNADQQITGYTAEKTLWQNYLTTLEMTSDEYESVMDSIEDIDSSIRSCIANQLEWKKTIAETDYNRLVSKYESLETKSDSRTKKLDYLESIGGFGSKSDYNALINLNRKQIQNLNAQNAELEKLRKNCDAGTDLWKEYTKSIQDNNSSILELNQSTAEYAETLYHLPIEKAASKTERLQKEFDLLEKKMEYAGSYASKNKYLDKQNSNEYRQLAAYREAAAAAEKSFYGVKSNLLKNINFQSLNGNDVQIVRQCILNGTTIPASIIAKMDSSSAAQANKYNASLKAKNEANDNYESYRYDYIANKKSRAQQKLEHINNYYDTELTKWTDQSNLYNAQSSLKEKLGVSQSRTDYNRLITNSRKQENLLNHQRAALHAQIQKNIASGVWSYNSEEYRNAKSTLSGIDETILKAKADQLEWNNAIQNIPLNTIEKLSSVLNLVKSKLEGLINLAEKHGTTASPSALEKLIFQSVSSANQAQESIDIYTKKINEKLSNGDWAKLTQKQLTKVWAYIEAGDINRLKNYFTYTLNIDPATLEEFFSDIDKIASETDKKFQAEIQAEDYLDRFFDLYIDKLNKVKEKLNEINDARQKALELEKLEAQLQKAKDNKTISIYREGIGMVYEADQNAIKEAQDSLDNYYYEQMIDHLDKISEILEELKETFNIYTDNGTLKTDYESIIAEALKTASGLYSEGLNSIGGSSGSFDIYNNLMQLGGLPASLQKQNLADMADRMRNSISAISSAARNKITNISLKLDNVSLPNIKSGQDAEKFIQELKRISLDALQYANKK